MLLQQYQVALQKKEKEMNLVKEQYEHQLHEVKSKKETSQLGYGQINYEKIEKPRRENQQGPTLIRPVGEKYPMDKTPHGIAVIINNFEFHSTVPGKNPLPGRRGSQVDEHNLCVMWKYLRYDVQVFRNLTASELTHQLTQIASQSHEKYDSFVCCILSQGYPDGVYGTDSKPVRINDIASLFKSPFCPTLTDKPKLFFIQSSRGDDEDKGSLAQKDDEDKVVVQKSDEDKVQKDEDKIVQKADDKVDDEIVQKTEDKVVVQKAEDKAVIQGSLRVVHKDPKGDSDDALHHSLPSEADFLFGYATPPGYVSWISPHYGSWYISKLCEVFVNYASKHDLLSMLTTVNRKVSEAYTKQGYKQCPAPVILLRKQVWFLGNPPI